MIPFRDYGEHGDGLPVAWMHKQPGQPELKDRVHEINYLLADHDNLYAWPQVGIENVRNLLAEYGIQLPDVDLDDDIDSDEMVFAVKPPDESVIEPMYLYLYYGKPKEEDDRFEVYGELVNDAELHDLLDELDDDSDSEDETEDDIYDDRLE